MALTFPNRPNAKAAGPKHQPLIFPRTRLPACQLTHHYLSRDPNAARSSIWSASYVACRLEMGLLMCPPI
jgi:hypothetical protein